MLKKSIGWIVRGLVTFGILYYLSRSIDFDSLVSCLKNSNVYYVSLSVIIFGIVMFLLSIRWYILLSALDIIIPIRRLYFITLVGHFFNAFMLGSTGGDVSKLIYCIRDEPQKKSQAVISILFDRFLGLIVILALACVASVFAWSQWEGNKEVERIVLFLLIFFFGLVGTCLLVILYPLSAIPGYVVSLWEKLPLHEAAEKFLSDLRSLRHHSNAIAKALGVVLITEILVVMIGHFAALGVGLDVTVSQSAVVMSMVLCAIALPISISGHGVREGAFVFMYIAYGVIDKGSTSGNEMALATSFIFLGAGLLWSLIGGICFFLGNRNRKEAVKG